MILNWSVTPAGVSWNTENVPSEQVIDQGTDGVITNPSRFKAITSMMVDPFCVEIVV